MAPSGCRIEFGVFQGATLKLIAQHPGLTIGVDSFEGMPEPTASDVMPDGSIPYPKGRLAFGINRVAGLVPAAKLIRGFVPEILPVVPDGPYAFAHLDMDQYQSTLEALRWVRPRMLPGGIICCDDWLPGRDYLAAGAIEAFAREIDQEFQHAGRKAWWIV